MTNNALQLELHVDNFASVEAYYVALGFTVVWQQKSDGMAGYMVVQLEQNILCFWPGNQTVYEQPYFRQFPKDTVRGYGVEIVISINDIKGFYAAHKDAANVVEPLMLQPWGLYDFRAVDPSGYYLRFTSPHDITSEDNNKVADK